MSRGKVGVVGGGLIGSSWAVLFAAGGFEVVVCDLVPAQLEKCLLQIKDNLRVMEENGLLRGDLTVSQQLAAIRFTSELSEAVQDSVYVQECVFENRDTKEKIFAQLDALVSSPHTILASSTSSLPASTFTEGMKHRDQCIVAHPVNPPLFLKLVELCPSPWTRPDISAAAKEIQKCIGQAPILLKKEHPGFALNRLQYALFAEAWHLVKDGILDPDEVDLTVSEGLGPRWAFYGPWQIAHLNGPRINGEAGVHTYLDFFGQACIWPVSKELKPPEPLELNSPTGEKIKQSQLSQVPLDKLPEMYSQRDNYLLGVARLKQQQEKKEGI